MPDFLPHLNFPAALFSPEDVQFIRRVVKRIIRHPHDVMDVVQNALLQVFLSRESFRGESKRTTWMYRIAVNESLMHLRSSRQRVSRERFTEDVMARETTEYSIPPTQFPEDLLLQKEACESFDRLFSQLLPAHQQLLRLWMEGMTHQQIADAMGASESSVRNTQYRAYKKLRQLFEDRSVATL